ncbi:putative murein hydrolase (TIGR00659 family) [Paucimonas lemoignei]|uniref:Putative murein hydrolase (TIGR00659 family) n=1 Tax=Paucimonas lemoignei TaxID=29443 RepID=A0A4R3HSM6_PAULE|nr:LrgB family protein [Paucimonas lemoignei]TCS33476.1 putative murein hydrolase (TIGR00659 family) [Paucimonas lemoignei]
MSPDFSSIWVYLSTSPLLWLTATLLAYQVALALHVRAKGNPLVNPVMIAIAILVALLAVTKTPYKNYFDGAQFVHFLLGPATVALAIPLYQQLAKFKRHWLAFLVGTLAGSASAVISAMGIAWLLGASPAVVLSLAPKSVTTPIAMGIAEKIGGLPSLTAVMVILTGIIGASLAQYIMRAIKVRDDSVVGFAMGVTAHGLGTARAFQVSAEMGAFAGLAMGVTGALTAVLLPLALKLFGVI